ncbi:PIN domain-containing protein [Streptomyces sp. PT12]|uniref:PIN domain-containing protein n=1 Tax=Streptomyces sp. PT12 TaxID=1510197 RepID=UPI001C667CD7|nr:PIN domain-containing protein [Streptomyces sp. PT12]
MNQGIAEAKRERLRKLMIAAVRDCLVRDHEPLRTGLTLPDPDDRHVMAAAIEAGAQVIVTSHLKDFPAESLAPWGIEAKSPDEFVLDLISLDERVVYSCVQQIADERVSPPETSRRCWGSWSARASSSRSRCCATAPAPDSPAERAARPGRAVALRR